MGLHGLLQGCCKMITVHSYVSFMYSTEDICYPKMFQLGILKLNEVCIFVTPVSLICAKLDHTSLKHRL
jgi:hypothetical protein